MGNPGATAAVVGSVAAAQQQQIMLNAIRSWGPVVKIEPEGFLEILKNSERMDVAPLVVAATGGWFSTTYSYLTSYKGLYFYTKASYPLLLSSQIEVINVSKIWLPNA
jgi:hypothetical protein